MRSAMRIDATPTSSPVIGDRSTESTLPRIRLMQATTLCFSLSSSFIFYT